MFNRPLMLNIWHPIFPVWLSLMLSYMLPYMLSYMLSCLLSYLLSYMLSYLSYMLDCDRKMYPYPINMPTTTGTGVMGHQQDCHPSVSISLLYIYQLPVVVLPYSGWV